MTGTPRRLDWDSDFFGFEVAESVFDHAQPTDVEAAVATAREQGAALLVCRMPAGAVDPASLPGVLADTRHIYAMPPTRPVPDWPVDGLPGLEPYAARVMAPDLARLAVQSGRQSRFFRDPDFPRPAARALYTRWMERIVTRELSERVLVLVARGGDGCCTAMGATYLGTDGHGQPSLMAALPGRANSGFGRAYFRAMMMWFHDEGVTEARIRTQARAGAACNLYERAGWVLERREDIVHVWLDRPAGRAGSKDPA
ncbi:hypothetical protein [Hyphobacterium marinum]|uniref:N-acetyltransferase domain-containing protein n=1 Tax=Hyphobacterium marinum TaxID=3116574 RepID=A0ABU7LUF3_9PROT|nr:hypothetical protein [Hyphobacterium sp. Y6023]MEE2565164.1 hypothetical protein [Hyphobacterium sp. Y6023]